MVIITDIFKFLNFFLVLHQNVDSSRSTWLFWKFHGATGYKRIPKKIVKRFEEKLDEKNAKIIKLQSKIKTQDNSF